MIPFKIIAYNPFNSNVYCCSNKENHSHSDNIDNVNILNLIQYSQYSSFENAQIAIDAKFNNHIGILNLDFACLDCNLKPILINLIQLIKAPGNLCGIRADIKTISKILPILIKIFDSLKPCLNSDTIFNLIISQGLEVKSNKSDYTKKISAIKNNLNPHILFEASCDEDIEYCESNKNIDGIIVKGLEGGAKTSSKTSFIQLQELSKKTNKPFFVDGGIGHNNLVGLQLANATGFVINTVLLGLEHSYLPLKLANLLIHKEGNYHFNFKLGSSSYFNYFDSKIKFNQKDFNLDTFKSHLIKSLSSHDILLIGQDYLYLKYLHHASITNYRQLINLFQTEYDNSINYLKNVNPIQENSSLAQIHKTKFPVLQGAMTRVSDTAQFAKAVYDNGGLPFLAFALMKEDQVENLINETSQLFKDNSYGVGILGFIPSDLLNNQIKIITQHKPKFVLIAGGRPAQALHLESFGIQTYIHIPSIDILKSAIEEKCYKYIFEGLECGGHVGPKTSFVLWQIMTCEIISAIKNGCDPKLFHVILAGGIHDELSAAIASSILAPLHKLGVNVGVLMGSAYLYTTEAVETGAINKYFQDKAIEANNTVLLETTKGHSIRCIESPYFDYFENKKQELIKLGYTHSQIREELEYMNLGRLRIASKGITRDSNSNSFITLPSDSQWQEGMFMLGQIASQKSRTLTIHDLHHSVCSKSYDLIKEVRQSSIAISDSRQEIKDDIAIVGMSCDLPMATNLDQYWNNIINYVDAITEIPKSHFNYNNFYNQDKLAKDKIYSKWGGFLDYIKFNPAQYGIPPKTLPYIDPVQLITLELVKQALDDANYKTGVSQNTKTSVIVAHAGHGPITALYSMRSMLEWKLKNLPENIKTQIYDGLPEWNEDVFPGYLGNVIAGRVSNRFDFNGVNFSIDAACASSLAGLYTAILELRSQNSDLVILAGADTHNQPGDYLSFSKTFALSADGKCKTFDSNADGIVISEGVGVVILKRLGDAIKDGNKIYAVIKGIGGSSDGRDLSLTAPRVNGQLYALNRAYQDARIDPQDVSLIEAHGTGTVAGDKAEIEALSNLIPQTKTKQNCAIGSVKTMIGHTKAAAGVASLIKVAKSIFHQTIPATLNVKNPSIDFSNTNFYINLKNKPFVKCTNKFNAGLSAFGFGGTNFHCVLSEFKLNNQIKGYKKYFEKEIFLFVGSSFNDLINNIEIFKNKYNEFEISKDRFIEISYLSHQLAYDKTSSYHKLAVLASNYNELISKINKFCSTTIQNKKYDFKEHIFYDVIEDKPKISFLFPGQGSQYVNMLSDLCLQFDEVRKVFELGNNILQSYFERSFSDYIYPPHSFDKLQQDNHIINLAKTNFAQPAMAISDLAVLKLVNSLGIKPDMTCGHSFGEYVSLYSAGCFDEIDLINLSYDRGLVLNNDKIYGTMVALNVDYNQLKSKIANSNIYIANINSPKQCVIAGEINSIEQVLQKLDDISFAKIKVSKPFHTPLMNLAAQEFKNKLKNYCFNKSLKYPTYKNLDSEIYNQTSDINEILTQHIVSPIDFDQLIKNQYSDGARVFLELGPNNVLTNLTKDILGDKDYLALSIDSKSDSITNLQITLAQLFVNNIDYIYEVLFKNRICNNSDITKIMSDNSKNYYKLNSIECIKNDVEPDFKTEIKILNQNQMVTKMDDNQINNNQDNSQLNKLILNYQNSMLEITKTFVESQKAVMLAYLQKANNLSNLEDLNKLEPFDINNSKVNIPVDFANNFNLKSDNKIDIINLDYSNNQRGSNGNGNGNGNGNYSNNITNKTQDSNGQTLSNQQLKTRFIEIVSEKTGYPTEMLDHKLDIEADLGIDSIKRIEILNNFRKLLPSHIQQNLESNIEELASLKTLETILNWIDNLDLTQHKETVETAKKKNNKIDYNSKNLSKYFVINQLAPLNKQTFYKNFNGITLVFVNDDKISQDLVKELGNQSKFLFVSFDDSIDNDYIVSSKSNNAYVVKSNFESLSKLLDYFICNKIEPNNIFYFAPYLNFENNINILENLFNILKSFKDIWAKSNYSHNYLFALTSSSNLNSDKLPNLINYQSGIGAMLRSYQMEMKNVIVKTVDIDKNYNDLVNIIANEINHNDNEKDIIYSKNERYKIICQNNDELLSSEIQLNSNPTILVTGGARGITASILKEIINYCKPNLIILGQSDIEDLKINSNYHKYSNYKNEQDIKLAIINDFKSYNKPINFKEIDAICKTILKVQQIEDNLNFLKNNSSQLNYYSIDLSTKDSYSKINSVLSTISSIDLIIHGAGIIEDNKLENKSITSFNKVVSTKIIALELLLEAIKSNNISVDKLVLFSSIVGRTGNAYQLDYCAANDILNNCVDQITNKFGIKTKSLLWGPWQSGMARPELKELFNSYGWDTISSEDGCNYFISELNNFNHNKVIITKDLTPTPNFDNLPLIKNAKIIVNEPNLLKIKVNIDTNEHVYLNSHKFESTPVMPFAAVISMMTEMIKSIKADYIIDDIFDFKIPSGLIFDTQSKDIILTNRTIFRSLNINQSELSLTIDRDKISKKHFVCKANHYNKFKSPFNEMPKIDISSFISIQNEDNIPTKEEIYSKYMFHGELFQGINDIYKLNESSITGCVNASSPNRCLKYNNTIDNMLKWQFDPIAFDSAMQLAGIWAKRYLNILVLPAGFEQMKFYNAFSDTKYYVKVDINTETEFLEICCNMSIYDTSGNLILTVNKLKGIGSKALDRLFDFAVK